MSKNIFTCLLAVALFCLIQDSVYASPQFSQPVYRYGEEIQMPTNDGSPEEEEDNDLIQALENLYIENRFQLVEMGLGIKQALLQRINDWEIDTQTAKYIVRKLDENLSGQQGRVGDVWRRVRGLVVSGMASKLLRGVDLKQTVKDVIARVDLDQLIRYIPSGSY